MENPNLLKRCIAESIGTALLVLIGAGTAAFSGMSAIKNNTPATLADIGVIAFSFGIAIMVMIYTIGKFSGGHINPAVTIGLAATGHFPWKEVPAYIISQLIGGVVGAYGIVVVLGVDGALLGHLGTTVTGSATGYLQGIAVEAIATFILMFAIMGNAVDSRAYKQWGGCVIGITAAGIIMLTASATGPSFNPARTFGPYVVESMLGGNNNWIQFPIYIIGPLFGAIIAAFTYKTISVSKKNTLSQPVTKISNH